MRDTYGHRVQNSSDTRPCRRAMVRLLIIQSISIANSNLINAAPMWLAERFNSANVFESYRVR